MNANVVTSNPYLMSRLAEVIEKDWPIREKIDDLIALLSEAIEDHIDEELNIAIATASQRSE